MDDELCDDCGAEATVWGDNYSLCAACDFLNDIQEEDEWER